MSGITTFEQFGELYLESLCDDAYYQGAAGTIVDAVNCGSGGHSLAAAEKLTHGAMGYLQRTIGRISRDGIDEYCDWARIDSILTATKERPSKTDQLWLHKQLNEQGKRTWDTYHSYLSGGVNHDGGIHQNWLHDLALAATFLQAAAALVDEAFNLDTEVSQ